MAEVYRLAALHNPARVRKLLQAVADIERDSLVAVKLRMGELINYRFIRPPFVRELVTAIKEAGGKPFLTDILLHCIPERGTMRSIIWKLRDGTGSILPRLARQCSSLMA